MLKRLIGFFVALIFVFSVCAFVVNAENTITAQSTGYTDVQFSNGYKGFCLDNKLTGAYNGDGFTVANNTNAVTSNVNSYVLANKLKIMFTQCFADIFVPDGNGSYTYKDATVLNNIQAVIWYYNAAYDTPCQMSLKAATTEPLTQIVSKDRASAPFLSIKYSSSSAISFSVLSVEINPNI